MERDSPSLYPLVFLDMPEKIKKLLWVLLLLAGCSGVPELERVRQVDEMRIVWVRGIEKECAGAKSPTGCAERLGDAGCKITTPEDAPDEILAHEFRHCFGYRHAR